MRYRLCVPLVCLVLLFVSSFAGAAERTIDFTVSKGDSLINICKKYLEDPNKWQEIAKINKLKNPNRIYAGQTLIIPATFLKGAPTQGVVTFVKGDVKVQPPGGNELTPLRHNDRVREGSKIKTGDESSVEITLEDGSIIFQRSNTELGIVTAKQKGGVQFIHKLSLEAGKVVTRIKGATGHESRFEIDTPTSTGVARGTEFRTSVDNDKATRYEVLEGTVSVAGRTNKIDVRQGEGAVVRKDGSGIEARKLLPPPAQADPEPVYKNLPLRLRFMEVEGARSYRVMIAKDETFRDTVEDQVIRPRDAMEIRSIRDGSYFLQSVSIDDAGIEGLPSSAVLVEVKVNPLPPFIRSPEQKGEYKEKTVEFGWLRVQDASRYQIQVAEDGGFRTVVEDKADLQNLSYTFVAPAPKTYFFRIRSIAGDGYEGTWSDTVNFSMVPPPPAPPQVQEVETTKTEKDEMYVKWTDLGPGFTYRMQMAADRDFNTILADKVSDKAEAVVTRPTDPGTYYVRTSGIDTRGLEGDFSQPQSFEIARRVPAPAPPPARTPYELFGIMGAILLIILLAL
jgi:hypothetical protein